MASAYSIKTDLTAEYVRSILDYDPKTGVFTWRRRSDISPPVSKRLVGRPAGAIQRRPNRQTSYVRLAVHGQHYLAHRLAWLYIHGEWPSGSLDHINGDGTDNRIANLRLATNSLNQRNGPTRKDNKCGLKGVYEFQGRFRAQIRIEGRARHLGMFDTPEEAHAAYMAAAREHFGEFARAG